MPQIVYVNGRYVNYHDAFVHVEDRGYQFADGIYEVCEVYYGKLVDKRRHLDRLFRSLNELQMMSPMRREALEFVINQVISRNRVKNGMVYIQITRGVAPRDHAFPKEYVKSAIVIYAKNVRRSIGNLVAENGTKAITVKDNRWDRVDIKSVSLLPNCLAKQKAAEQGAREAILIDDEGYVTEGAATTIWIVDKNGNLITRPDGTGILAGITKRTAMKVAKELGLNVEERKFTKDELFAAKEVFMTAATTLVMPIVEIDGVRIGNSLPKDNDNCFALKLRRSFHKHAELD